MRTRRTILVLAAIVAVLLMSGRLPRSADAGGSRRYGEAIVLSGMDMAPFFGAIAEELWVWVWDGTSWQLQVSQLDERSETGAYVAAEDGALDENDEFVFDLPDHGAEAPEGSWPPGMDADAPWMRVKVVDPLQPGVDTYAYVLLSRGGPEIALPPRVTWDPDASEVRTHSYVLGFADPAQDGFVGFKRLSLFVSATDLLDRLKLRLTVSLAGFGEQTVTEEELALLGVDVGALSPDPVIAGPVRLVLDANGTAMAYGERFVFRLAVFDDTALPPGLSLVSARASMDLSSEALPATYADANVPAGVGIDGEPDDVPQRPIPAWREVSLSDGRLAFLRPAEELPATASLYYQDEQRPIAGDTGDGMSLGDQGVFADNLDDFAGAGFPGDIVALPVDASVTAAMLAENVAAPVELDLEVGNLPPTQTAGPTMTASSTPTPSATTIPPTGTPTPVPTAPTGGPRLYLPLASRGA